MKIDVSVVGKVATLSLAGEFDTFSYTSLTNEVERLLVGGTVNVILNMRLVRFVNSSALAAVVRADKLCRKADGMLVISEPSPFARDIFGKFGIQNIVPVVDNDAQAIATMLRDERGAAEELSVPVFVSGGELADQESLLHAVARFVESCGYELEADGLPQALTFHEEV